MIRHLGMAGLLRRHYGRVLAGLGLMLLTLLAAIALLGLSGWFITASAMAGLGLIILFDIFTPGAGIRLAALTRTVSRYGERLVTHDLTFRLLADLRLRSFRQLLRKPSTTLAGLRRGDTLQRLTRDIDSLDQLFIGITGPSLAALLLSLLALVLLALLDWQLALASVGLLLGMAILISVLAYRTSRRPSRQAQALMPQLRNLASEGLDARTELSALDLIGAQAERIRAQSIQLGRVQQGLGMVDAFGQGAITLVQLLALWTGLVFGLALLEQGLINGPLLGLLVLALLGLGEAFQALPMAWRRLGQCQAAAERLEPLLGSDSASREASGSAWPKHYDIRFNDIDFRYGPHSPPVLVDFNLRVQPGEQLVLRGPSGIGKTTLARLLIEECAPQSGQILIGDQPLAELSEQDKRTRIGYLPQQSVLFADSIAANLRLAEPEASDEKLLAVLDQVGLGGLVAEMPAGLDSWIEEQGRNLSGGQQRRLCLARLLLSDPRIVILDEPTSGLDRATARSLMQGIQPWLADRTVLIISHDPELAGTRVVNLTASADGRLISG
jgi:ATP-binding cassette, subfamily C, bacterial CydC